MSVSKQKTYRAPNFNNLDSGSCYTVTPALANYHFASVARSFSLVADQTNANFAASSDGLVATNAIDTNEYFVRQQYLDCWVANLIRLDSILGPVN